MTERTCKHCKTKFEARTADVKRGWAKFCSKRCKAIKQEQRTGQHRAHQTREHIRQVNGATPREFQKQHGGMPSFDRKGRYEGFTLGPGPFNED